MDLSRFESSAEKNPFSRRNRIWQRREVTKPRRHTKKDERGDWAEEAFPGSLDDFLDQERNKEAFGALRASARDKEVRRFVVCGPRGAGKTAACVAYVRDFARLDADAKAEGAARRADQGGATQPRPTGRGWREVVPPRATKPNLQSQRRQLGRSA